MTRTLTAIACMIALSACRADLPHRDAHKYQCTPVQFNEVVRQSKLCPALKEDHSNAHVRQRCINELRLSLCDYRPRMGAKGRAGLPTPTCTLR